MDTRLLSLTHWLPLELAHEARVDEATAGHRARRAAGTPHPVEDFLFTYYRHRPARLRRWHPGAGVVLEDAARMPRATWRYYRASSAGRAGVELDVAGYLSDRGDTVRFVHDLLVRTAARPAQLGCFGLHEWAMVHRQPPSEVRHRGWPLRLGAAGTDEVVETQQIRCTHYDAFRFFTPSAVALNTLAPTRERQAELEQPGCLHAGMDLYKWAYKLGPLVPGDLLVDCFDLAGRIRELDMRASPYDLTDLGYDSVPIETAAGRAAYVTGQRDLAAQAAPLRQLLIAITATATPATPATPATALSG